MENVIDTLKVNRSIFAYRIVDVHNDEFGFAQDGFLYTYVTDSKSKTKGTTWLRMQSTGESGKDRRKYFLYFGDETEYTAVVDKHNDIYDLEGNYVASLVRSKFILSVIISIMLIILITGIATYLGGSMIMDTSNPFSQDKTIHLAEEDSTTGQGSSEVDMDIFDGSNDNQNDATTPEGATDEEDDPDDYKGSLLSDLIGEKDFLYPGCEGKYTFHVQNDGKKPLNYQLSFSAENLYKIPMRYKLLADDEYVVGSKTEWAEIKDILDARQALAPNSSVKYTLVWQWEDEGTEEANERDTKIASSGVAELVLHATVYFESSI